MNYILLSGRSEPASSLLGKNTLLSNMVNCIKNLEHTEYTQILGTHKLRSKQFNFVNLYGKF